MRRWLAISDCEQAQAASIALVTFKTTEPQMTLINLGCRTNAAETDEIAALLSDARNFVVINSCTVTTAADRDTRKAVARARREHPEAAVVLMGCYVDAHPADSLGADMVIPNAWKRAPVGVEAEIEPPRIRLSSIDPSHIDPELAGLLEHPRVCPHLHLPLQSGSDRVLARMRRRYDLATFENAVAMARAARPDMALTGDIMVGFPGETANDFERTLEAIERAGFSGLHVFRFSPRPRTAAARYPDQVPISEAQDRSRRTIELGQRLGAGYEAKFHGKPLQVIWDRPTERRIKGLSENYIQVTAPAAGRRPGQLEEVVWDGSSAMANATHAGKS